MTWTVLVPMLLSSADPERVTHWERIFYSFESMNVCCGCSRNGGEQPAGVLGRASLSTVASPAWLTAPLLQQHGLNAVMMLGELALGCIPLKVVHSGYMALLASLYGVHSAIFFARTGRFIYPFLDA